MTQEKKRLGLTVPIVLYEKILKKAEFQGKTINSLCIDLFWNYFDMTDTEEHKKRCT